MAKVAPQENRRGLVAHWKYHGSVSALGTWYDLSGNGNNGTLNGNAFVDNQGVDLDGSDYVDCGNGSSVNITGEITLSAWVYFNSLTSYAAAISKGTLAVPRDTFTLRYAPGLIQFRIGKDSTERTASKAFSTTGQWVHLVGVYNKTQVFVYVDGIVGGTIDSYTGDIGISSTSLRIGEGNNDPTRRINGIIDDARVYNRALSAEEILQMYHNTRRY